MHSLQQHTNQIACSRRTWGRERGRGGDAARDRQGRYWIKGFGIGKRGWEVGGNGLKRAHGGIHATRVEVRALQLDLAREEEQLREATRLTDKRKV